MTRTFNVIVEEGEDGYLISEVVELPGCHTQAKSYDELLKRTKEAISLYLSVNLVIRGPWRSILQEQKRIKYVLTNACFRAR